MSFSRIARAIDPSLFIGLPRTKTYMRACGALDEDVLHGGPGLDNAVQVVTSSFFWRGLGFLSGPGLTNETEVRKGILPAIIKPQVPC